MKVNAKNNANSTGKMSIFLRILLWLNILIALFMLGSYLATHISPQSFSLIAFLGLGYPIWLSLSVAFIIFWLIRRKKFYLISVISILIGFNHLRNFFVITVFQTELQEPIKIMSYNVRIFDFWNADERIENRDNIFAFLKEENSDIICFQEFFHQESPTNFVTRDSMIELIETPYYHEHYTHDMAESRYFGLATFSKYPIVNQGEIAFENDANNYCIYSDIVIKKDTFRVFNGHIGSIRFQDDDYSFFGDEGPGRYLDREGGHQIASRLKVAFEKRAIQSEIIANEIDASQYPVILCLDMNDTPVSYAYRQFDSRLEDGFTESGNGVGTTYIGKMPSNRIDYIFHSELLKSADFTTHQVDYSDHKPISIKFELSKD